jgi:hypothetical protein
MFSKLVKILKNVVKSLFTTFTECGLYMLDNIYYTLSIHVTTILNNVVCLFLSQHFLNVVEECFEYVLTTFIERCVINFFF